MKKLVSVLVLGSFVSSVYAWTDASINYYQPIAAYEALKPSAKKKRGARKGKSAVELPAALAEALKNLPAGYRLGVAPDGTPKLVKTRTRRKKGE